MTNGAATTRRPGLHHVVVAAWCALLSGFVIVGADCLWAVALGRSVLRTGSLRPDLPYAAPVVTDWPGPLAIGETILALAATVAPWGLAAFQVLVVAVLLALIAREVTERGGGPMHAALAVSLLAVGSLLALAITRLPTLSLIPFTLLVLLLRRQHEQPTRAVWLAVPLIAGWANLHGGVLIGAAVLGAYLLGSRLRPRPVEAVAVGAAGLLALCVTPAGPGTVRYYAGVLGNEAARRGSDLWARPDPGNVLDLLMLLSAVVLVVLWLRTGPPAWEWLAVLGLAAGMVMTARNGTWLLILLAAGLGRRGAGSEPVRTPRVSALTTVVVVALALAVCGWQVVRRGEQVRAPGSAAASALAALAAGRVVLAPEPLAETLADRGLRVWAGNPVDAFPRPVQAAYLDFLHDGRIDPTVMSGVQVVVVVAGSTAARAVVADPGWRERGRVGDYLLYERAS